MNSIFIRATFNELEMLKQNSWQNIKTILKKYDEEKKSHPFEYEFSIFLKKLVFNDITSTEVSEFLNSQYKEGKVSDYISIEKDENNNYFIEKIKYDEVFDISRNLPFLDKVNMQFKTSIQNPIINLITFYERFIRQLITYDCFEGDFEIVKNETITFDKLLTLNYDKETIKNFMVKSYCNNKLYGDKKRIEEIINTFHIDCNDCEDLIAEFNEVYFRRNMYVHSIVDLTNDYLGLPNSVTETWAPKGVLLETLEYLNHAFYTVYKLFLMILIKKYLAKQKCEEDLEIIEENLFEEIYSKKMYLVAKFGYEQLKKLKWIGKSQRYRYFINYMHCLKKLKSKDLPNELQKWNTDTDANIYKLSKKLIENDYININNLINDVILSEKEYKELSEDEQSLHIVKEDVETWPLFEDYRKTEYYTLLKDSNVFKL